MNNKLLRIIKRTIQQLSSRKAAVFTIVSVLFAALFISIFTYDYSDDATLQIEAVNTRVKVLDDYVKNFQQYTEQSLQIASYSTLDSMYYLMINNKRFYYNSSEFNSTFVNCITCAYTNCLTKTTACPYLDNHTLTILINNITGLADDKLNIKTYYDIQSITVYQTYPFDVEVDMVISYKISDVLDGEYASWNITQTIHQIVPINTLLDPSTGLNTNNTYKKRLIAYSGSCAYNETCWNLANTQAFYQSQQFRYFANGTNYLQRFWNGTASSSCCGIESFLNSTGAKGNNSYVDNYYWTNQYVCPGPFNVTLLRIDGIAPGFMLDYSTATRYNLVGYANTSCS